MDINLKSKIIKNKIAQILLFLIGILLVFVSSVSLLFASPYMQTSLARYAAKYFSQALHTEVEIDRVQLFFLDELQLKGVLVKDQLSDTLIYASTIDVEIGEYELSKHTMSFDYLEFGGLTSLVHRSEEGDFNYQFIFDLLSQSDSKNTIPLDLFCKDLVIENAKFRYWDETVDYQTSGIDYYDMKIDSLFLDASDLHYYHDTLFAAIDLFRLTESSGFNLDNLNLALTFSKGHIVGKDVHLEIGNTDINADVELLFNKARDFAYYIDSVRMKVVARPSILNLKDLGYFAPVLFQMDNEIRFTAKAKGTVGNFKASKLNFAIGRRTQFRGKLRMRGLPNVRETFAQLKVKQFYSSMNDLEKFQIPTETGHVVFSDFLRRIGNLNIKGNFTGFYNDFVSFARYTTDVGSFSTDIKVGLDARSKIQYDGFIEGHKVEAGYWINMQDRLKTLDFNLRVKGEGVEFAKMKIEADGMVENIEISGNNIRNIELGGVLKKKEFVGKVVVDDELVGFDFEGLLDFSQEIPKYNFITQIRHLDLKEFKLFPEDSVAILRTRMDINAIGKELDDIQGYISLGNTILEKNGNTYDFGNINLSMTKDSESNHALRLYSPSLDASMDGKVDFTNLLSDVKQMLAYYSPNYLPSYQTEPVLNRQNFVFDFKLKKVKDLFSALLGININSSEIDGKGSFSNNLNYIDFQLGMNRLEYKGKTVIDPSLQIIPKDNSLFAEFRAKSIGISDTLRMDSVRMFSSLYQDSIKYNLAWKSTKKWNQDRADILGVIHLDTAYISNHFLPSSSIVLLGEEWDIHPENLILFRASETKFENITLMNEKEMVAVNGAFANQDTLTLKMRNLNVQNFESFYHSYKLDFDGKITGEVNVLPNDSAFQILANLKVDSICFNKIHLGDASITSVWEDEREALKINGGIIKTGNIGKQKTVSIDGEYLPFAKNDNFNISVLLDNYKLKTIQPFIEVFSSSLDGMASGKLHLGGSPGKPMILGEVNLKRVSLGIDYTNTEYFFADKIVFDTNLIHFENIRLTDVENNFALVEGAFKHNYFDDFEYFIHINTDKILGLNTEMLQNEYFYGKAIVDGDILIQGDFNQVNIAINANSQKDTKITLPIDYSLDLVDNDYIVFVSPQDTLKVEEEVVEEVKKSSSITVNTNFVVNEDAELDLIMPFDMGNISGQGNGDLQINYDENGELSINGEYRIQKGKYQMNLQGVLRKEFSLLPNSTITWSGDPYDADINIRAAYDLRARLGEYARAEDSATVVPVECIITLKNSLMNPSIYFGIEFPDLGEDVKQTIYSRLDTANQALMSRQVISLLVVNSFNYSSGYTSSLQSSGITLVTNQINNWLSSLSDDFDLGINYRSGDNITEDELGLMLSTQLFDDRVSIKGNLGVRNETGEGNKDSFIGEGEIEVKLTRDGKFRLKAFNKSNNDYLFQDYSRYTQGVGLFYRREFNKVVDLWGKGEE